MERIVAYTEVEQELKPTEQGKPPAAWPTSGEIKVENLTARYSKVSHTTRLPCSLAAGLTVNGRLDPLSYMNCASIFGLANELVLSVGPEVERSVGVVHPRNDTHTLSELPDPGAPSMHPYGGIRVLRWPENE